MLRVFGETPGGQKTCLHVHRLFPYLYVPYDDDLPRDADGATFFLRSLAEALDRALDFGERAAAGGGAGAGGGGGGAHEAHGVTHNTYTNTLNASGTLPGGPGDPNVGVPFAPRPGTGDRRDTFQRRSRRRKVVHACALVRARSMYGFHAHERLFVKISLYDPACVSRVRAALLSGGVAERTFQPFEAHVPFPLQAMMDLNLTGAGVARCAEACFREPLPRWPRAHARRVATRRRLRLGSATMEEEEEGFVLEEEGARRGARGDGARRRRAPVELEYEDVEPTPRGPFPFGARELAESFGLFKEAGEAATTTSAASAEKKDKDTQSPVDGNDGNVLSSREGTDPTDPPPPRVWTRNTVPRRWTRVALRPRRFPETPGDASQEEDKASPSPSARLSSESDTHADANTAPPPPRTSNVELEVDVLAEAILNPRETTFARDGSISVRLVPSLRSVWDEEKRRAALENRAVPPPPPPAARLAFAETSVARDENRKRLLARVAAAARAETIASANGAGDDAAPREFDLATVHDWALGSPTPSGVGGEPATVRSTPGDEESLESALPANRASAPATALDFFSPRAEILSPSETQRDGSRPRRGSVPRAFSASQQPSQMLREKLAFSRGPRNDGLPDAAAVTGDAPREDAAAVTGDDVERRVPRLSVDRELVVVSQAAASVSPGGTQDDPMYGLLLHFAKGETDSVFDGRDGAETETKTDRDEKKESRRKDVSEAARRVSLAAVAAGAAAREAAEVRDLRREYDDDDDDDEGDTPLSNRQRALTQEEDMDELNLFVAATQREWADLRDVLGTVEEDDADAKGTEPASLRVSPTVSPRRDRRETAPQTAPLRREPDAREKKVCAVCGEDCSRERRVFSRARGYAHKRCADFERDVSSAKARVLSTRKRRASESVAAPTFDDTPGRPSDADKASSSPSPVAGSNTRACFHCGDALIGEKGVRSPARGYAHVRCARALGWKIPRRGSFRGDPGSAGLAGPGKTRFAPEASVAEDAAGVGKESERSPATESLLQDALFALRRRVAPPTVAALRASAPSLGVPEAVHETVFYGDPRDAPARAAVVSGVPLKVRTNRPEDLRAFFTPRNTRDETTNAANETKTKTKTTLAAAFPNVAAVKDDDAGEGRRRTPRYALRPLRPPPRRDRLERYARRRGLIKTAIDPERREKGATPDDPATPRDETETPPPPRNAAPGVNVPPSPFHPPPRVSLRAGSAASPSVGPLGLSTSEEEGSASRDFAANARLDAWLDSLDLVGDAAGTSGGVSSGRGQSGPAQIGLGDAADADDAGDESRNALERPPSPKYEEQNGYLEHLRFHGCEAHEGDDAEAFVIPSRARAAAARGKTQTPPSDANAHVGPFSRVGSAPPPSSVKRPRPRAGFRYRADRPGASQVTQPTDEAGSTPRSDSFGFASDKKAKDVSGAGRTDDAFARARVAGAPVPPMGVLCVETIGGTRGELLPDPQHDPILTIGLCFSADGGATRRRLALSLTRRGRVNNGDGENGVRSETSEDDSDENDDDEPSWVWGPEHAVPGDVECHAFDDERALLRGFIATVLALDPDVLIGFEVQGESLGFLADRARRLDVDLLRHVSRSESVPGANERQDDEYGRLHASGIYVTGRIVLNLWRVLRGELKLQSYAFESCVSAVLGRRVPKFSAKTLSRWAVGGDDDSSREKKPKRETNVREGVYDANHDDSNKKPKKPPSSHQRWRAIHHVCARALLVSKMCEQLDVVARTNEQAKIFGIDFQSVVFRGSQYRVESMMLRLAHLENYLAPSPSAEQTSRQPAMECLPLVMEPESKLYVDPVAVLDFASLYPSVVCAYNLCFSTCLGKVPDQRDLDAMFDETGDEKEKASRTGLRADQVAGLGGGPPRKLGCHELALPPGLLPAMLHASDKNGARRPSDADGEPEPAPRSENPPGVTVTPNGVMFAPKNVRPGILPRLLAEILDTRAMVKSCLKHAPADAKARRRALNAKQFGLKLIANVTYGYTAAGFSGRMPMAELADAIVQCGRDTLERAIRTVHSGDARWRGARVVYGDTDSLFVHFPGYSKASAFEAAAAIAAAVTADNPDPVTLKLEKVYHPCILATKKRYVGHAYESPTQRAPLFDAKGIEVARRDSCPLLVKTQRVALQLLFHNKDLSLVKRYVQRHVAKLRAGRIPLGDLVFAKETRLGTYSKTPGAQKPPAAIVAESLMARDPRAEPKFGERVPYVVVCGEPGGRLMDMIAHPRAVAEARGTLRINAKYYGDKVIAPAMQRLLGLVGADVSAWLREPAALASGNDFAKRAFAAPLASTFGSSSPFENARKHQSARRNIDQFFLSVRCAVCGELTEAPRIVCVACASSPGAAAATLAWRAAALERDAAKLARVCLGCGGGGGAVTPAGFAFRGCGEFISGGDPGKGHAREVSLSVGAVECVSLDCALFYRRRKTETELRAAAAHVDAAFQRGGGLDETR